MAACRVTAATGRRRRGDTPEPSHAAAVGADNVRLRALVADVVAAGYAEPPPRWLTDELWDRLVAEAPLPAAVRPDTDQDHLW